MCTHMCVCVCARANSASTALSRIRRDSVCVACEMTAFPERGPCRLVRSRRRRPGMNCLPAASHGGRHGFAPAGQQGFPRPHAGSEGDAGGVGGSSCLAVSQGIRAERGLAGV